MSVHKPKFMVDSDTLTYLWFVITLCLSYFLFFSSISSRSTECRQIERYILHLWGDVVCHKRTQRNNMLERIVQILTEKIKHRHSGVQIAVKCVKLM